MSILVVAFLLASAVDPEAPPQLLDMAPAATIAQAPPPTTTTTTPATTATTATTEPATPPADPAATPTEPPPSPPPAPVEETAPVEAPVGPRVAPVASEDVTANAAYDECLRLAGRVTTTNLTACFARVGTKYPDSLAAIRARANVSLLEAEHDLVNGEEKQGWLPPGRLELVGVAGLFGVWNAIAGGVLVATNVEGGNPGALLIGISAASLALGVGFGVGGAAIGDALKLDEGASRMVASGIVWGTNMGIGLLPVVFDLDREGNGSAAIITVLGAGWAGGLGTLALTNVLRLDTPSVSMVNSGGIWGSVVGGLVMLNLANARVQPSAAYSAAYIGANFVGLVGGGLLSQTVNVSWGETLVFDLGAVIGGSVLGFGTTGLLIASGNDGQFATPIITSAVGVGVIGGYAVGMVTTSMLRGVDAPFLRSFGATVKPTTPKPMAVLDSVGQPVSMMPIVALAF